MADLNTVNNTLNQILDTLKNPPERKVKEGNSKESFEGEDILKTISSFDFSSKSVGSALNSVADSAFTAVGQLGPFGKATEIAGKAVLAFGKAAGKAMEAIMTSTKTVLDFQNKANDLANENWKHFRELNAKMQSEGIKFQTDIQLKQLETQGQILMNAAKLVTGQFIKGAEVSIGSLVDGINESAYRAAEAKITYEAESKKNLNIQQKLEQVYGRFQEVRSKEYEYLQQGTQAESETYSIQKAYEKGQLGLDQANWLREHYVARGFTETDKLIEQAKLSAKYAKEGDGWVNLESPDEIMGENIKEGNGKSILRDLGWFAGSHEARNDYVKGLYETMIKPQIIGREQHEANIKATNEVSLTVKKSNQELQDRMADVTLEAANMVVDAQKELQINWLKFAESNEKWIQEFDKVTNNLGLSMGYTNKNQMAEFQKSMFQMANVASEFGKTYEDFAKVQHAFIETTGRNRGFNQSDARSAMALGYILGDDGLAANYASEMEIFNTGVADSVDLLGEALDDVNKMGLNSRKYTKTLVDNLKLAQKYNFKGGTKGLMEMAKWAQNTRFNMSSLSGMLDKISEGGLEGIITQGAQFQVLGGHSAMNADPLAMLYERYADPAALAKRFQDMTKGYGHLDTVTGETSFSGNELMLIEQIAKTQGRSVEDVQNEIRQRNKVGVVAKQLRGDFDSDAQALISNAATYDRKTGQFKVNVKNADGTYSSRDVSELTKEDIDRLMPEEHNARMEEWVSEIVSNTAKLAGAAEKGRATVAGATWDEVHENFKQRMETFDDDIYKHIDEYISKAKEYTNQITDSYGEYTLAFQTAAEKANEFEPSIEGIQKMANSLGVVLGNTVQILAEANKKLGIATTVITKGQEPDYGNNKYNAFPNKVVPINDGLVLPDPKDVGIFAKEGGPIGNFLNDLYTDVKLLMGGEGGKFNVEISGKLDLSSGGKSVDIISEIQTNPILLRALSQMLAEHMSSAINGGRGKHPLAYGSV